jgi:transposase
MKLYGAIDLHSSNNYLAVTDQNDKRLYGRRLPNRLDVVSDVLEPFKEDLAGIVVESTFNWYWLVDGLQEKGYRVHLANPSAVKQYEGLKHADDKWDAFWLCHLLRLGILPTGYIYPKEARPVRDLLRRRVLFVRHRTSHILSTQSMIERVVGKHLSAREIEKLDGEAIGQLFHQPQSELAVKSNIAAIQFYNTQIRELEKEVLDQVKLRDDFNMLLTIPGIGKILGLTIMLEVGDIGRFPTVGDYCSYCRCVKAVRLSNGKKKGDNNHKNGNKYLSWAYVEAAHFAKRFCPEALMFYHRKLAKRNEAVAVKALSSKLARASYYLMRDRVPFDVKKLFR